MPSNFLLTFHINNNFKRQSHNYPKFPKVKAHNNFWKQILTRRINLFCWNFGDLITITTTIKITITLRLLNTKWWMTAFAIHIHNCITTIYVFQSIITIHLRILDQIRIISISWYIASLKLSTITIKISITITCTLAS